MLKVIILTKEEAKDFWQAIWDGELPNLLDRWYVGGYLTFFIQPYVLEPHQSLFPEEREVWLQGNADSRGDWS